MEPPNSNEFPSLFPIITEVFILALIISLIFSKSRPNKILTIRRFDWSFCPTNYRPKMSLKNISKREKQQILEAEDLKPANDWYFPLINTAE